MNARALRTDVNPMRIVEDARRFYADRYADRPDRAGLAGGSCLYWACAVIVAAHTHGLRLIMNAGSAMFRRLPPHLDDGKPETLSHFAYEWTPPRLDPHRVEPCHPLLTTRPGPHGTPRPCLPEIHIWAGDPITQTLVDLSTGDLKDQCERVGRMPWLDVDPPPFLWCHVTEVPDGWRYAPSAEATVHAMLLATMFA